MLVEGRMPGERNGNGHAPRVRPRPQTPAAPAARPPHPAGFPSPADDWLDGEIDLKQHLIERPAATFLMRVSGCSMTGAGILDGDLVVVDRSLKPRPGQGVVVGCVRKLAV
jgi:DNA polymerase V